MSDRASLFAIYACCAACVFVALVGATTEKWGYIASAMAWLSAAMGFAAGRESGR